MTPSETRATNSDIAASLSPLERDSKSASYQATYDSARDSTSLAVVAVVAAALDMEPQNLAPLQTVVETDALDKLATSSEDSGGHHSISFPYEGVEVTVTGAGVIEADLIGSA